MGDLLCSIDNTYAVQFNMHTSMGLWGQKPPARCHMAARGAKQGLAVIPITITIPITLTIPTVILLMRFLTQFACDPDRCWSVTFFTITHNHNTNTNGTTTDAFPNTFCMRCAPLLVGDVFEKHDARVHLQVLRKLL